MTKIPNYVLKSFIPACLSFSGYILLSIAKNSLFSWAVRVGMWLKASQISCVQQAKQYVYTMTRNTKSMIRLFQMSTNAFLAFDIAQPWPQGFLQYTFGTCRRKYIDYSVPLVLGSHDFFRCVHRQSGEKINK